MNIQSNKTSLQITAVVLLFIVGLNALAAGYGFMVDPSGAGLGIKTSYLQYSFFKNFLIPGIILFSALGVGSCVTAILAVVKAKNYTDYIVIQGVILTVWIIVQVILVRDFNLLHFVCLAIGISLIFLGNRINKIVFPKRLF